jgi:ribonuclease R
VAEVIDFIRESPSAVGKREIARAFAVAPSSRPELRDMLRRIERSGAVTRAPNRRFVAAAAIPEAAIIEGSGSDEDGVALARPVAWPGPDPAPIFRVVEAGTDALRVGERAAARLIQLENGEIEARIIRRLEPAGERIIGTFETGRDGGRLQRVDRRDRNEYRVAPGDSGNAECGDLVIAEQLPARRFGAPRVRIVERIGPASDPGAISLMAIAAYDIPTEFPAAAIAEANAALPVSPAGRTDLREIPLVTIDGSDARDFDDAVWAEPDRDPQNPGGWHLIVAIADVAWYVRPGSALDREAERRGNSVYFPDRVVPMLPEALSNELCSLKPEVDRACLSVHLWIDAAGRKRRHRFERSIMRSAARLTYEEVQAARDGRRPSTLSEASLAALYGAFTTLAEARRKRGALDLDIAEHRVLLDAEKRPVAVERAIRLDSHRLIEDFMILANVAAAEQLEACRLPCIYRVHDAPDPEKVEALRIFLEEAGIPGLALAKGQAPKPELFNRVLRRAAGTPQAVLVNDLVLRCQAQAVYSANNIGHFGLALRRYAHFTSPIRRYADLLVHRALIAGVMKSDNTGALPPHTGHEQLQAIAGHISATERRAAEAERTAIERYRATLLAASVGRLFSARISGVANFGLFVTLQQNGADGLVPISTLPADYYDRDEKGRSLVGRYTGCMYRLGDELLVRLIDADGLGGRLVLRIEEGETAANPRAPTGKRTLASRRRERRRR